jgi:hypothetical protein
LHEREWLVASVSADVLLNLYHKGHSVNTAGWARERERERERRRRRRSVGNKKEKIWSMHVGWGRAFVLHG